ncbi:MAG: TetR/AcrR family transcriptional regulator [Burkholderiales bacterium]
MDTRTRILDAALGLLAGRGAHELTQPKVARAAGLRQSHLTYYFPTRADLMQAVARHSIEMLAAEMAHARHTPQAVAQGIATGAADKRRVRLMLGLVAAADRDPAIKRRLRRFIPELRGLMAPMLEAGALRTDPASVAFFHAVTIGCAVLQLARDNDEAHAEARSVLGFAAQCLRKAEA